MCNTHLTCFIVFKYQGLICPWSNALKCPKLFRCWQSITKKSLLKCKLFHDLLFLVGLDSLNTNIAVNSSALSKLVSMRLFPHLG